MTSLDINCTSKGIQRQSAKGFSGLLWNSKLMEEMYNNPLEEHKNWVGVEDGFPKETAICGEDEGAGRRRSQAEQQ